MKTTAEMIAVMQAFERGEKIERRPDGRSPWVEVEEPAFNWGTSDYRIKPREPRVIWVNEFQDGDVAAFPVKDWAARVGNSPKFKRTAVKYIEVIE